MTSIKVNRNLLTLLGSASRIDPDWLQRLKPLGLTDPACWRIFADGEVASASRSTNCFRVTLPTGELVYFKRYVYFNWRLRSLLLVSKAGAEAWGLKQMNTVGCVTPKVLAYGEQRVMGNIRAAFLVTQAVEETQSLADLARQQEQSPDPERWCKLIKMAADSLLPQLQEMHRSGLFHYDLKWRNLLLNESTGSVVIIDCPRARRRRWRRFRGQVVDLSALSRVALIHLSQFQRLRFFLCYLGPGYDRVRARKLLAAINAHLSRRPPKNWDRG
ncbi:MAG: hypothetical protein JKY89_12700 [Immundisolibacteraceae bacterium]|nr:hypothetical protein [Immundisolibacteraceae bacterium]